MADVREGVAPDRQQRLATDAVAQPRWNLRDRFAQMQVMAFGGLELRRFDARPSVRRFDPVRQIAMRHDQTPPKPCFHESKVIRLAQRQCDRHHLDKKFRGRAEVDRRHLVKLSMPRVSRLDSLGLRGAIEETAVMSVRLFDLPY